MRHYRFEATAQTVEALRLLRRAWRDYARDRDSIVVRLVDGGAVRIESDRADVEGQLEAYRIRASQIETEDDRWRDATGFALGGNDVVLFAGATWVLTPGGPQTEPSDDEQVMQFSGHPGQIPEEADAVCITTDAVVIASSVGTGILVRLGLRPNSIEVIDDATEIARFVTERGYVG